jgi:hypothetical protein
MHGEHGSAARGSALARRFEQFFRRFLDPLHGAKRRMQLSLLVLALILVSVALLVIGWVQLKMLPLIINPSFSWCWICPPVRHWKKLRCAA